MPQKLCYILPEYRSDDATHFSHIHDFLKEISKSFDIFLIVEKGSVPNKALGYRNVYLLYFSFLPLRALETFFILLWVRLEGYRNFYVHYSFMSAFFASLVGRTFYWNCGEPWKYKRNFLREFFERAVYKMITFQVTGAASLADKYADYYGISVNKIKIMPNWIDLKRFASPLSRGAARDKLNLPHDAKIVLFAHHLSPRKGSRMILPVAQSVAATEPNALFLVAGAGPDEKFLRDEIIRLGLSKNARIIGAIPNRELPDYFSASDVFFMPSEEEGFPRVLLESMALGVPFVASDAGAAKEIAEPSMQAYIVKSGDIAVFSAKLGELLETFPNKEISIRVREWVKRYDISTVGAHFSKLFI